MRVVVNAMSTAGARTGVGHHTSALLAALRAAAGDDVVAYPTGAARLALDAWAGLRRNIGRAPGGGQARLGLRGSAVQAVRRAGLAAAERHFQAFCRRAGAGVYHEPNYLPFATDLPTVVTVHDLSALLHPEWHPAERVADFGRRFRSGVGRTTHILTVSESARREIAGALGLPLDRVTCTYNGLRPGLEPAAPGVVADVRRRLGLPPRYLLYLGTMEPRKNVLTLLRAYAALPGPVREGCPLVLVGGWGWGAHDVARFLEEEGPRAGVLHLGYVAEADLAGLYTGARALAFPSRYEGFGLPPVEMLACGGAVLAGTAAAVVETVGGQAHLIDPDDEAGWRDALHRVVTDDDWWRTLRAGAREAAAPYTWERCAAGTLAVYRQVLRETARAA